MLITEESLFFMGGLLTHRGLRDEFFSKKTLTERNNGWLRVVCMLEQEIWRIPVHPNKSNLYFCLSLILLLVTTISAQEPKKMVKRTFDMSFLNVSGTGEVSSSHELPLRASIGERSIEDYVAEARGQRLENRDISIEEVVELIRSACLTTDEAEEYTTIEMTDQKLVIRTIPTTMPLIVEALKFFEELATRNATVEIINVDSSSLNSTKAGLLTPQEVAALLQNSKTISRQRAVMNLGQMARLDASRTRQYVVDYDAEVAEKSFIADPIVAALLEGTQFGVRVEECPDGRFMMRVQGRVCKRIGTDRIVHSPATGIGALELPKTRSAVVAMNAIVTPGSGFLIGSHESGNNPWLIRLIQVDAKPSFSKINYFSSGCLNRTVFSPSLKSVIGPRRSEELGDIDREASDDCVFAVDAVMESMRQYYESRMDEEFTPRITQFGPRTFVRATANIGGMLHKSAIDQIAPVMRNVSTEIRYDLVDDSLLSDLLDSNVDEMSSQLKRQARFFTRTGSRGLVASGEEWLSLKDKNVEIASGSRIADPIIDSLFTGVVFSARPAITVTGDITMALDYTFQSNTGAGRIFDTGIPEVGSIDGDDLTHVHGNARFKAKKGKWALVHTAPLSGTGTTFVLMARANYK